MFIIYIYKDGPSLNDPSCPGRDVTGFSPFPFDLKTFLSYSISVLDTLIIF